MGRRLDAFIALPPYPGSVRIKKNSPISHPADKACRICGKVTKLSYEHVPPKAVGNDGKVEMLGMDAWLAREGPEADKLRGTISQRGSGAYSLCRECNSRAGELYVPEFLQWHNVGADVINQQDLTALDSQMENIAVDLEIEKVRPGRFMKQVVTMLLAIAPGGFAKANPELAEYALKPEKLGLPPRYKIYLALYAGPLARFDGGAVRVSAGPEGVGSNVLILEIAYPPFAYVLAIDETEPSVETCDVTNLTEPGIDVETEVRMTLQIGFGHTMYPTDFRTRARLQKERAENEAEARIPDPDSRRAR